MIAMFALTLVGAFASLGVAIYFVKRGQFNDCEDVKYQMFREDD